MVWCALQFHPEVLHPSLKVSMDFIYHDANTWASMKDFLPSGPMAVCLAYMLFENRSNLRVLLRMSDAPKK